MGKVLTSGHAEKDYRPDLCKITLSVETEESTADKTTAAALTEFERLLSRLADIGIQPRNLVITGNSSSKPYNRRDGGFRAEKTVRLEIPVNIPLVNRIQKTIADGFENVTLSVSYDLAAREQLIRELTRSAIQDSRKTAELLAETVNLNVVGIEAANLTGDDNLDMDIADLDMAILDDDMEEICEPCRGIGTPFSDRLTPEKITLRADVRIVWLVE